MAIYINSLHESNKALFKYLSTATGRILKRRNIKFMLAGFDEKNIATIYYNSVKTRLTFFISQID